MLIGYLEPEMAFYGIPQYDGIEAVDACFVEWQIEVGIGDAGNGFAEQG
jgi:hypothetical protein